MNAIVIDDFSAASHLVPSRLTEVKKFGAPLPVGTPEESLALGVLSQAAHDLRRFHKPGNSLERQLYRDAYAWMVANDFTWPYSFVNICKLLDVPPETFRTEILAEASLGWLGYWCKLGERFGRAFGASLARTFEGPRSTAGQLNLGRDPIKL